VLLPKFLPWTEGLVEECAAFPTGAHDDQVDATSQALNKLMVNAGAGTAWMEYARRQAEAKAEGGTSDPATRDRTRH